MMLNHWLKDVFSVGSNRSALEKWVSSGSSTNTLMTLPKMEQRFEVTLPYQRSSPHHWCRRLGLAWTCPDPLSSEPGWAHWSHPAPDSPRSAGCRSASQARRQRCHAHTNDRTSEDFSAFGTRRRNWWTCLLDIYGSWTVVFSVITLETSDCAAPL